jgi:hypothetical protein
MGRYEHLIMKVSFEVCFSDSDTGVKVDDIPSDIKNWAYAYFTEFRRIREQLIFVDYLQQMSVEWDTNSMFVTFLTDGYINDYLEADDICVRNMMEMIKEEENDHLNKVGAYNYHVYNVIIDVVASDPV